MCVVYRRSEKQNEKKIIIKKKSQYFNCAISPSINTISETLEKEAKINLRSNEGSLFSRYTFLGGCNIV